MTMSADQRRLLMAAVLLAVAGLLMFLWLRRPAPGEQAFFYDVSAGRIFTADRTAVPPIRGVDGEEQDGFRAVVISTTGRAADHGSWSVAYLERYSPELKMQMEQAQKTGGSPGIGRGMTGFHRFVRRLSDEQWYPMASPEAEAILAEWLTAGPGGGPAVICKP